MIDDKIIQKQLETVIKKELNSPEIKLVVKQKVAESLTLLNIKEIINSIIEKEFNDFIDNEFFDNDYIYVETGFESEEFRYQIRKLIKDNWKSILTKVVESKVMIGAFQKEIEKKIITEIKELDFMDYVDLDLGEELVNEASNHLQSKFKQKKNEIMKLLFEG